MSLLTHVVPNLYDFMEHNMDIYNACMMFLVFIYFNFLNLSLSFIVFLNFKMLCFTKKIYILNKVTLDRNNMRGE